MKSLLALLLFITTLLAPGCDTLAPEPVRPSTGLTSMPVPRGHSLFAQGESAGKSGSLATSPYGCLVSSPHASMSPSERYLYQAFYVGFPDSVVASAGGRLRHFTMSVGVQGRYASAGDGVVKVREARCLIPASDRAAALMEAQVLRFTESEETAWQGETMEVPSGLSKVQGWVRVYYYVESCVDIGEGYDVELIRKTGSSQGCTGEWRSRLEWVDEAIGSSGSGGGGSTNPWGGGTSGTAPSGDRSGTGPESEVCLAASSLEEMYALGCGPEDDPYGYNALWPKVKSESMNQLYDRKCASGAATQDKGKLFEMNVAEAFGMNMSEDGTTGGFDGYGKYAYNTREGVITNYVTIIAETKLVSDYTFDLYPNRNTIDQAKRHIDYLVSERSRLAADTQISATIGGSTYIVIATSPHDNLDERNEVLEYAINNGINLVVYSLRNRLTDWYFSGVRYNTVLGGFGGNYISYSNYSLPFWLRVLDPLASSPRNVNISMDCYPNPIKKNP